MYRAAIRLAWPDKHFPFYFHTESPETTFDRREEGREAGDAVPEFRPLQAGLCSRLKTMCVRFGNNATSLCFHSQTLSTSIGVTPTELMFLF
uniref:Uncharacterized protein n=1 Tax=Anguilla anguilla TaxID=7936 RepID=A0A0E9X8N1_ANGAN